VEYIVEKQISCGVVLDEKPNKLRILTESNREVSLSEKRLTSASKECLDVSVGRNGLLGRLAEIIAKRKGLKKTVNVFEIWEVMNNEERWFEAKTIAEVYFGDNPSEDHVSAIVRAFFEDRLYFKFGTNRFSPRTAEQVDQLLKRKKEEADRERMLEAGGNWLREVMDTGTGNSPPAGDELIEVLKSFYVFDKESPHYRLGRDLLNRAGFHSKDVLFDILVKLGVWDPDENLNLVEYEVPDSFSKEILDEAERVWRDAAGQPLGVNPLRKDLTRLPTLTIDGQGTLDFDDALSIEHEEDGYRVWVHVADVAHFIHPGSLLDQDAMCRASSIYMPDKRIPMFPPQISEQLCSLRLEEDKPALSLMISIDRSGEVRSFEFVESVIRVDRQFTYYEANTMLEADEELAALYALAVQFRKQRLGAGALQFTLPEIQILIDEERLVSLGRINREGPSRVTVAEFMIMANWLAGRFLRQRGTPAIYRSQGGPRERLLGAEDGTLLQNWLQRRLISRVVISPDPDTHAGLGLDAYSSWTSPIRKCFDLVAQRQIKGEIGNNSRTYSTNEIRRVIQVVEEPMRRTMSVQQKRRRYWLLRYLEQIKGEEIEALVVEKRRDRYIILLLNVVMETWLPVSCGLDLNPGYTVYVKVDKVSPRLDTLSVSLSGNQKKIGDN